MSSRSRAQGTGRLLSSWSCLSADGAGARSASSHACATLSTCVRSARTCGARSGCHDMRARGVSSRCTTSLPVEGSSGRGSSRWSGCHTPRPELGEEAGQDGGVALAEDRARPQHRRLQPVQHRPLHRRLRRQLGRGVLVGLTAQRRRRRPLRHPTLGRPAGHAVGVASRVVEGGCRHVHETHAAGARAATQYRDRRLQIRSVVSGAVQSPRRPRHAESRAVDDCLLPGTQLGPATARGSGA